MIVASFALGFPSFKWGLVGVERKIIREVMDGLPRNSAGRKTCWQTKLKTKRLSDIYSTKLIGNQLNTDNLDRGLNGMIEGLAFFKRSEGLLITHTQRDYFEKDGKWIRVLPVHEYLTGSTN